MVNYGTGADGSVVFTTTTKSYGNLKISTDYNVSGNILYLQGDRIFNFVDFELGSGCELRVNNSTSTTVP